MKRLFVVSLLVTALALSGCQKEESAPITAPPGQGGVGGPSPVQMNKEIETLKSILQKDPNNLRTLIRLGNIYMDTNQFPEAISMYERALVIDPKNTNIRVDMGTCYFRMRRADLAEPVFREAVEMDPTHAFGNMNLGVALSALGRYSEAADQFEKYLQLDPGTPNAPGIKQEIERLRQAAAQQETQSTGQTAQ